MSPEAHSFSKPSRKRHSKAFPGNAQRANMRKTPFVPDGPKKALNPRGLAGHTMSRAAGWGEDTRLARKFGKARSIIFLEV